MIEIPKRIMVQDIVRLVELGQDLDEVGRVKANGCREDVILRIIEVVPPPGVDRLDPTCEAVTNEWVANLRPQREDDFANGDSAVSAQGVVADQRPEAVGAHQVESF